jgi:hypothetical protein
MNVLRCGRHSGRELPTVGAVDQCREGYSWIKSLMTSLRSLSRTSWSMAFDSRNQ